MGELIARMTCLVLGHWWYDDYSGSGHRKAKQWQQPEMCLHCGKWE